MATTPPVVPTRARRSAPPATDAAAPESGDAPAAEGTILPAGDAEARVLLAFENHQPNDVVMLTADELRAAVDAGYVDADPAAVAYAKGLLA